ncbi:MAG: superoxide dismutase [Cyanobacteria bacterium M5B4]|nr:MAG: superoxide dismutase [Cyanobacteria bacterium M5B4]
MNRRTFLLTAVPALMVFPATAQATTPIYEVPPLPYAYDALEPYIDAQTMRFHHDRHHAAYVNNLNKALANYPELQRKCLVELIQNLDQVPAAIRTSIRNNGGGHLNHTLFWQIMSPQGGGAPTGAIAKAIDAKFGSFAQFQNAFEQAGVTLFGSGWVWLVKDQNDLAIMTTPNQDSPLMAGKFPILGNDVWEHAYYLNYQNRRLDYLKAWWNVVNWEGVSLRWENA